MTAVVTTLPAAVAARSAAGRSGTGAGDLDGTLVERSLLRRYRDGDLAARDALVARFTPLARRLARRYRNSAEPLEDLEQAAYIGLLKAIDRYDCDLGPFVRFAVPNILGELRHHFRDRGWALHVSRPVQERGLRVTEAIEFLRQRLRRSPAPAEIAEHLGLSVEEVLEAIEARDSYALASLDAPPAGDPEAGPALGETLGVPEQHFELVELGASIAPALRALPQRQREILHLRFVHDLKQSEIAEQLGISQMHVSRLLRRSLDRLDVAASA